MDTRANDADTDQNMKTVSGPHALLRPAESSIRPHRMYVPNLYSKHNIIAHASIKFISILGKLKTGLMNSSIKKQIWSGLNGT